MTKINSGASVATLLSENNNVNIMGSDSTWIFLSDANVTKELKAKSQRDISTALFTVVKTWKQLKCVC